MSPAEEIVFHSCIQLWCAARSGLSHHCSTRLFLLDHKNLYRIRGIYWDVSGNFPEGNLEQRVKMFTLAWSHRSQWPLTSHSPQQWGFQRIDWQNLQSWFCTKEHSKLIWSWYEALADHLNQIKRNNYSSYNLFKHFIGSIEELDSMKREKTARQEGIKVRNRIQPIQVSSK